MAPAASTPAASAPAPPGTAPAPPGTAPARRAAATPPLSPAAAGRRREASVPQDLAMYTCQCGFVFEAAVLTSVDCPHCGGSQAW